MFTGARKKKREMDWQLVASYFTVKVHQAQNSTSNGAKFVVEAKRITYLDFLTELALNGVEYS